jgi:hypothetical protein
MDWRKYSMDKVVYMGDKFMGRLIKISPQGTIETNKEIFACNQKMLNIIEVDNYETFINGLLDDVKQAKIQELSTACNLDILSGFLSSAYQNTENHYDCEYTDQSRIAGLVSIAQLRLMSLSDETISYKASGELSCYEWLPQEIMQLGLDLKRHIESKTNKFYRLRIQVLDCSDESQINAISW